MAVGHDEAGVLLPCGRDALEVWDRAADGGIDAHAASCPYCGEVVAAHTSLAATTRDLADEPVEPPLHLVAHVMGSVRLGLRRRAPLALDSPYGPASIDAAAAAGVLAHAVGARPDVRIRSLDIRSLDIPSLDIRRAGAASIGHGGGDAGGGAGPSVERDARTITITATVEVRAGVRLPPALRTLRVTLIEAAAASLGLRAARVDIEVTDVFGAGS